MRTQVLLRGGRAADAVRRAQGRQVHRARLASHDDQDGVGVDSRTAEHERRMAHLQPEEIVATADP